MTPDDEIEVALGEEEEEQAAPTYGIRSNGMEVDAAHIYLFLLDEDPKTAPDDAVGDALTWDMRKVLGDDGIVRVLANPNADILKLGTESPEFEVKLDYASQYDVKHITDQCAYDPDAGIVSIPTSTTVATSPCSGRFPPK